MRYRPTSLLGLLLFSRDLPVNTIFCALQITMQWKRPSVTVQIGCVMRFLTSLVSVERALAQACPNVFNLLVLNGKSNGLKQRISKQDESLFFELMGLKEYLFLLVNRDFCLLKDFS